MSDTKSQTQDEMMEDGAVDHKLEDTEAEGETETTVPVKIAMGEEVGYEEEEEEEEEKEVTQQLIKSESPTATVSAQVLDGKNAIDNSERPSNKSVLSTCAFPIASHEDEDEDEQLYPKQDADPRKSPQKKLNQYSTIPSDTCTSENKTRYSPDSVTTVEFGLAQDTYSMMMVSPFNSQAWWIAFFTFSIQFILFVMIFGSQVQSGRDSSYFNAPVRVTSFTRCAQFLAISILFILQKDLADSVLLIAMFITDENKYQHMCTLLKVTIDFEKEPNKYWRGFRNRILYPNLFKLLQGFLALITSFVIVIQSSDVIELFKDFSALSVISTVSIVVYRLIGDGSMLSSATKVQEAIRHVESTSFTRHFRQRCRVPLQRIIMFLVFLILYILWGTVVNHQTTGRYFNQKYPRCNIPKALHRKLGDGQCDGGLLTHIDCDFDGGDCVSFLLAWPECYAEEPFRVGNGICDVEYDKESCGWDGGDCCNARTREELKRLGDGNCDEEFNNFGCNYDKKDCTEINELFESAYPNCFAEFKSFIGNGVCDGVGYISDSCGRDGGDCDACVQKIKEMQKNNIREVHRNFVGDGTCNPKLNITACNYDGGDCIGVESSGAPIFFPSDAPASTNRSYAPASTDRSSVESESEATPSSFYYGYRSLLEEDEDTFLFDIDDGEI